MQSTMQAEISAATLALAADGVADAQMRELWADNEDREMRMSGLRAQT